MDGGARHIPILQEEGIHNDNTTLLTRVIKTTVICQEVHHLDRTLLHMPLRIPNYQFHLLQARRHWHQDKALETRQLRLHQQDRRHGGELNNINKTDHTNKSTDPIFPLPAVDRQ